MMSGSFTPNLPIHISLKLMPNLTYLIMIPWNTAIQLANDKVVVVGVVIGQGEIFVHS